MGLPMTTPSSMAMVARRAPVQDDWPQVVSRPPNDPSLSCKAASCHGHVSMTGGLVSLDRVRRPHEPRCQFSGRYCICPDWKIPVKSYCSFRKVALGFPATVTAMNFPSGDTAKAPSFRFEPVLATLIGAEPLIGTE